MKRISAIAIALLLMIGLTSESQAVRSGSYRCVALQDTIDGGLTVTIPFAMHYNPNGGVQQITRLRVFDSLGVSLFDSGPIPAGAFPVPGNGSAVALAGTSGVPEGIQYLVNWKQAADVKAPVARLDLVTFDIATGAATSIAQSNCP